MENSGNFATKGEANTDWVGPFWTLTGVAMMAVSMWIAGSSHPLACIAPALISAMMYKKGVGA